MSHHSVGGWLLGYILLLGLATPRLSRAQDVPLERCDSLPLVTAEINGQTMQLLLDTAASSLLNANSFTPGRLLDVHIASWTGTRETSASEVTIREFIIGRTKLVALKLPAIELSEVGKACGRRIDGILGADLLAKIGATIDLKRKVMHLTTVDEEREMRLAKEVQEEIAHCLTAFNDSNEFSFSECLDPKITLHIRDRTLAGRDLVLQYFCENYLHQMPAAKLSVEENSFHRVGEAIWFGYKFTAFSALGVFHGEGMALCRKTNGRWRIAGMHQAFESLEAEEE
jgi:hypothetical protein